MNKLFLPAGARIVGDVVTLKSGVRVPAWSCVAVPILTDRPPASRPKTAKTGRDPQFFDVLTGSRVTVGVDGSSGSSGSEYDVSGFSRNIDLSKLKKSVEASLPVLVSDDVSAESDPGYFSQISAEARSYEVTTVSSSDVYGSDYDLGGGYSLFDALSWRRRKQSLSGQAGRSAQMIVLAAKHVAVNVAARVNEKNQYAAESEDGRLVNEALSHTVYSWIVERSNATPDPESYLGECVRLEFVGSVTQVYRKAMDVSVKLPVDRVWLDYRSDGAPLVTVISRPGSSLRRVGTRYDGTVVSDSMLLHCVVGTDAPDGISADGTVSDQTVGHFAGDDYWGIYYAVTQNPSVFGGTSAAQSLLQSLGFNANPLLSSQFGSPVSSSSLTSPASLSSVASAVTCPTSVTKDPRLFPISSSPNLRHLTDVSQLDDGATQDTTSFALRANNPLRVKKVAGVTDLKTRFGYLGEAGGIAVYRDHVGGAAAGLNYVMGMSGSTLGSVVKTSFGDSLAPGSVTPSTSQGLTTLTPAKVFQDLSQSLFGVPDPSGALAECATIGEDSDTVIAYAATVAKTVNGLQTSPLTHAEWSSALQIAKNQPNGHLTKTTTGVPLPAQEEQDTQDTGTMTASQAKSTSTTADPSRRGSSEKWNPLANFSHYSSNVWGPSGSGWISQGIISYEKKTSAEDLTRMAKADETQVMNQDTENPTTHVNLDWDVS